jgi:maltokinase
VSDNRAELLDELLRRARWFGGKGRSFHTVEVLRAGRLDAGDVADLAVVIDLVEVAYDDAAGGTELYQVPLACYSSHQPHLDHALVGIWTDPELGEVHGYDAVHDRAAMQAWMTAFAATAPANPSEAVSAGTEGLSFHVLPGHDLDTDVHSTLFSGEQSNSSVAFGEDALMKVFRKVTAGENPDIAIHEVLTRAGCANVAALYGWLEVTLDGEVIQLAMLQQFLRTASDGWDLAQASARNLYAEADLHADEVGGDFAGESARLGEAVAEVHEALRQHFPAAAADVHDIAQRMVARLDDALTVVPGLAEHEPLLRRIFTLLEGVTLRVQRIHGDLHLGQTLRTSLGWKVVDFEGEPAKPLAERVRPDSPWRDVAGMVRSFDYAARVVERTLGEENPASQHQLDFRASQWAERNRAAFLSAYVGGRDLTDEEQILLAAYVADKAVYEAVYETRNRPTWASIPLAAIARLEGS